MNEKMKLLIAYDGSESANAMLDDLKLAGLPNNAEVKVLSIGELWLAPPPSYGMVETDFVDEFPFDLEPVRKLALRASERIKSIYPNWEVVPEAYAGSPAHEILKRAYNCKPNLIIVGSQGQSAFSRFILGSVAQKVVTEARCSVRISRGRLHEELCPARIVIGVDGSPCSDAALKMVATRLWPKGSEVRLVTSIGFNLPGAGIGRVAHVIQEVRDYAQKIQKRSETVLGTAGLRISSLIREGDPKQVLLEEAEKWGADCIFVGSRGLSCFKRFLLGSVSMAVAVRAHCSVEVVRTKEKTTSQ